MKYTSLKKLVLITAFLQIFIFLTDVHLFANLLFLLYVKNNLWKKNPTRIELMLLHALQLPGNTYN